MSVDYLFKLIFIGDSAVGKTELLLQLSDSSNAACTTRKCIDYRERTITVNGRTIKLQMRDTASMEQYSSLTGSYYRGAMGIFLVYDVSNEKSFVNLHTWLANINECAPDNCIVMLMGNNCHQTKERVISKERGEEFANEMEILFFEVSSKKNINLDKALFSLVDKIMKNSQEINDPVRLGNRI